MNFSKVFFLVFVFSFSSYLFSQEYSRVKVYGTNEELLKLSNLGVTIDHGIRKEGFFFISDFSKNEISIMQSYGYKYEILIEDVQAFYIDRLNNPEKYGEAVVKNSSCTSTGGGSGSGTFNPATPSNFNLGTMGGYLKYNEMLAELDAMAAQYPNIISAKAPISTFLTVGNRPLYYVKISDNPNTNEVSEPKILYTAIHHAREPMSLMETIFYMWYLLENYGTNDEVTYLVNNTQMFFVPCINPDGYVYNETTNPNGGGMWRKNRRNNGGGVYGVDLNRNYSYGWGTTGTSTNTSNDTYCGPSAFSEPETQAMRWLVQNNDFEMAFNAHTYAEDILFPIGTTTAEFAPHHNYFQDYTNHMVELNGYTAMKSSALYPASGDSDDYMYKVDVGVGQKDTIFVHTPEVGTAFWQPSSEIIATCKEMVFPNLILSHMARNYNIVKDTDPSSVATISGSFNHSIKRLGRQSGPVIVSIEPLLNIVSVGNSITYNLNCQQTSTSAISYSLNPSIQFGDQIKYILKTDNGLWIKRDTIVKTFGAITLQALEDATSTTNWTGTWSTTTSTFVSPSKSFFDGSTGNYANNANKTYTYVPTIDLTTATSAMVSFYAKWAIEADYDFVQFQVSTDGGVTWIGQCGNYTVLGTSANGSVQPNGQPVYEGTQSNWVLEEINLSDYLGQQIKVRFQLKSDGGTTADGYYFDDFKIFYSIPTSNPPIASFSTPNSICLGATNSFTDFSSNSPSTWAWDFGDGSTSNQQNPSHTYSSSGTYTATLTVTNASGTNTTSQTINVIALPVVTLVSNDADNIVCQNDGIVQLTATPSSSILTGNGVENSTFDPLSSGIGIQTIFANFTDVNGCVGTAQLQISVVDCAEINESEINKVIIYPNPTEGIITISGISSTSFYSLYDINGKKLTHGQTLTDKELINLTGYSNGSYYLELDTESGQRVRFKIILLY